MHFASHESELKYFFKTRKTKIKSNMQNLSIKKEWENIITLDWEQNICSCLSVDRLLPSPI